jgi:3-methyladenine DNA glycosylase AlkD
VKAVIEDLEKLAHPEKATFLQGFFKTGVGQYAEGDVFMGISMPQIRTIAKKHRGIPVQHCIDLLYDERHEVRMTALIMMVDAFKKGNAANAEFIYQSYMNHRNQVNNWDLVDLSASYIPGVWLLNRNREILYQMITSHRLWDRRIAVVATHHFIRNNDFGDTLYLCSGLLTDTEDLMHKACGWMLREVGKKNIDVLRGFLTDFAPRMPRTMLRYAIERFPEKERQWWLSVKKNS